MRALLTTLLVLAAWPALACDRQGDGLCDEPYIGSGLCPLNSDFADCAGQQVWWGSDEGAIDPDEVFEMEPGRLRLARNEIFARHGRRFQSAELQAFFELRDWYSAAEGEPTLSAVERANVAVFKAEEEAQAQGLPHASGLPRPRASLSAEAWYDDGSHTAFEQVNGRERQVEVSAEGDVRERLVFGDRREIWDLMPADGQAVIYSPWYDPKVMLRLPAMLVLLKPVVEGEEQVQGERATRFRLTYQDGEESYWRGLVWVSADGVVLKADVTFRTYEGDSAYDGHVAFELRNIRRAPLEPVTPPDDLAIGYAG